MSVRLRALNILSWPIWMKLSAGFVIAVLLPVLLMLAATQSGLNETTLRNIQFFVSDNGKQQHQALVDALTNAQRELETFATDVNYESQIRSLLGGNASATMPVNTLINSYLLGQTFLKARIVDNDGTILTQISNRITTPSQGSDAQSLAYLNARTNTSHPITFSINPDRTIELTRKIFRGKETVGYLIVTLDSEAVILNRLLMTGNVYGAYTFLVTDDLEPVLFALSEDEKKAQNSLVSSVAVARAIGGVSETETYRIGAKRDTQVIGYYASISNPSDANAILFVLVTEASISAPTNALVTYFAGPRAFVLLIGMSLVLVVLVLLFNQVITPPLKNLRRAIHAMGRGEFEAPIQSTQREDEIGLLASAFSDMRAQVQAMFDELEARIANRARDINATQEVSRSAASQRDLQTLMDQVVELVVKHFTNIYHAQIFLVDQERLNAVLRASTGEVGKRLLERGHRLAVGSVSVIGQVMLHGQVIVARDTAVSQVHRRNEFLPDTRAELAIPLRIGEQVIGALDVQSKQRDAFDADEIAVLQTMADQIAVAIENARLYQESMLRLKEIEQTRRALTLTEWQEYVYAQRQRQLISQAGVSTGPDLSDLRQRALTEARPVIGKATDHGTIPIAVPIILSGQPLGAVEWELPPDQIDANTLQLAQELVNRLAITLDNARLFEESQRTIERERIVNAIAAKLTPQTEIDTILQVAIREVGQALRSPQVSVRLQHTNGNNGDQ